MLGISTVAVSNSRMPTLASAETRGVATMREMYFPATYSDTMTPYVNWCWVEYLVHGRDWSLGGMGQKTERWGSIP